ncbi:MAG: hypothetical protein WDO70_05245 [Alphaproteobacteria bacterium]
MTMAKAILAGAALIALSIILIGSRGSYAAASRGPFQIEHHSNTQANAGVFRLDVSSGEVSYCYLTGVMTNEASHLVCSPPVQ